MNRILPLAALFMLTACRATPSRHGAVRGGALEVLDGNETAIGQVVPYDASATPLVRLQSHGVAPLLHVRPGRLSADGALYYESPNCSGVPFLDAISMLLPGEISTRLASTAIGPPGRTVYVGVPFAKGRSMLVKSFSLDELCYVASFEAAAVAVSAVTDITTLRPPFTLRRAQ